MTILDLFRSGLDTVEIAKRLKIGEHEVERRLHAERNEERAVRERRERLKAYKRDWQRQTRARLRDIRRASN